MIWNVELDVDFMCMEFTNLFTYDFDVEFTEKVSSTANFASFDKCNFATFAKSGNKCAMVTWYM